MFELLLLLLLLIGLVVSVLSEMRTVLYRSTVWRFAVSAGWILASVGVYFLAQSLVFYGILFVVSYLGIVEESQYASVLLALSVISIVCGVSAVVALFLFGKKWVRILDRP